MFVWKRARCELFFLGALPEQIENPVSQRLVSYPLQHLINVIIICPAQNDAEKAGLNVFAGRVLCWQVNKQMLEWAT